MLQLDLDFIGRLLGAVLIVFAFAGALTSLHWKLFLENKIANQIAARMKPVEEKLELIFQTLLIINPDAVHKAQINMELDPMRKAHESQ